MGSNFLVITEASELDKVFGACSDKLIAVMYYTKNSPESRKGRSALEKTALNHSLSVFCVIDTDKLQGDSKYLSKIGNMPHFVFYYKDAIIANMGKFSDKEIEEAVSMCEQHIMTQNNRSNGSNPSSFNLNGIGGTGTAPVSQFPQINPMMIQQQILQNAMMQNPAYARQLMNNPSTLANLVQQQVQSMQLLLHHQQQQYQQMQNMADSNQKIPVSNQPLTFSGSMNPPNVQSAPSVTPTTNPFGLSSNDLKQLFQIFIMFQRLGYLPVPDKSEIVKTSSSSNASLNLDNIGLSDLSNQFGTVASTALALNDMNMLQKNAMTTSTPSHTDNDIQILPNGDQIVKLPNNMYGIIKKN